MELSVVFSKQNIKVIAALSITYFGSRVSLSPFQKQIAKVLSGQPPISLTLKDSPYPPLRRPPHRCAHPPTHYLTWALWEWTRVERTTSEHYILCIPNLFLKLVSLVYLESRKCLFFGGHSKKTVSLPSESFFIKRTFFGFC